MTFYSKNLTKWTRLETQNSTKIWPQTKRPNRFRIGPENFEIEINLAKVRRNMAILKFREIIKIEITNMSSKNIQMGCRRAMLWRWSNLDLQKFWIERGYSRRTRCCRKISRIMGWVSGRFLGREKIFIDMDRPVSDRKSSNEKTL